MNINHKSKVAFFVSSMKPNHKITMTPIHTTALAMPAPDAPVPPECWNDNGTAIATPDTAYLLAHREVVLPIGGTLRRYGIDRQDLADAIAEVQTLSLEAARRVRMPASAGEWRALGTTIAARWAIDRLREAEVRDRYDAGLCDEPDAYVAPTLRSEGSEGRGPADTKRDLDVLKELFDSGQMPEHGAEILSGEGDEVPLGEVAQELGISEDVARGRLRRMRAKFEARLGALGMLTILILVSLLFALPFGGGVISGRQGGMEPVVTPYERAAPLRKEALQKCEQENWQECLTKLDQAWKIDPAGDDTPQTQAARRQAERALDEPRRAPPR